jgi:hypothetical protein
MLRTLLQAESLKRSSEAGGPAAEKGRRIPGGYRAFRLHTYVIPMTRLCGLGAIVALIAIHNLAVLGAVNWPSIWMFA